MFIELRRMDALTVVHRVRNKERKQSTHGILFLLILFQIHQMETHREKSFSIYLCFVLLFNFNYSFNCVRREQQMEIVKRRQRMHYKFIHLNSRFL